MKRVLAAALTLLLGCSAGASQGTADPTPPGRVVDASASSGQPSPGASHGWRPAPPLPVVAALTPQSLASVPDVSVPAAIQRGLIAWAEPDHGGDYLATRFPVGTLVELCAKTCIVRRTNDFGPVGRSKIADLAVLDWEQICELPRSRGVCPGTIEAIGDIKLPQTDIDQGGTP